MAAAGGVKEARCAKHSLTTAIDYITETSLNNIGLEGPLKLLPNCRRSITTHGSSAV